MKRGEQEQGEFNEALLSGLLNLPGYIGDVARRLVQSACKKGCAHCVYCGVELHATPETKPEDIERVFSVKSFRLRLANSPSVVAWRDARA